MTVFLSGRATESDLFLKGICLRRRRELLYPHFTPTLPCSLLHSSSRHLCQLWMVFYGAERHSGEAAGGSVQVRCTQNSIRSLGWEDSLCVTGPRPFRLVHLQSELSLCPGVNTCLSVLKANLVTHFLPLSHRLFLDWRNSGAVSHSFCLHSVLIHFTQSLSPLTCTLDSFHTKWQWVYERVCQIPRSQWGNIGSWFEDICHNVTLPPAMLVYKPSSLSSSSVWG